MFHYIAENLKELYRQHADAQVKGASTSADKKGAIFQYGDWFDRYPHGVSKTDYEDAAEANPREPGTDAVLGDKSDLQSVEEFFASLSPPSKTDQSRKQARKNRSKSVSRAELVSSRADVARLQRHNSQSQQSSAAHLQAQQHMNQVNMPSQDVIEAALAAGYDPTSLFTSQHQSSPQQFLADFASHHPSLPILNTSPNMIHPSHAHQMDPSVHSANLSPFPDLAADFNNAYWNLDVLGLGPTSNFFDPMSSYFVPFNVDPPPQHNLGDDGVFAGQGPEAYGFALGAGTPVDLDLMHGGMVRNSGSVNGGRPVMGRRGTGTGLD